MSTNKRKRDAELPRVTYHAAGRTFDRLFKEDSLQAMQSVVRRKLGLAADVQVQLAQLRDGRTIDLEDDDDFDAFYSAAHSSSVVDVKVSEREANAVSSTIPSKPLQSSGLTETMVSLGSRDTQTPSPEKFGGSNKRERHVTFLEGTTGNEGETPLVSEEPERKKRKSAPHIKEGQSKAAGTTATKEAIPVPSTVAAEIQSKKQKEHDDLEHKSKKPKAVISGGVEKKQKKSAKKSELSKSTPNESGEKRSRGPRDTGNNIASSIVDDSNSTLMTVNATSGEVDPVDEQPGDKSSNEFEEDLVSRKGKEKKPLGKGKKLVSGSDKATDAEGVSEKQQTVPKPSKKANESDTKLKAGRKKANNKASKSAESSKAAEETPQTGRLSIDATRTVTKDVIQALLARKRAATQTPAPEDSKVSDVPDIGDSTAATTEKTTIKEFTIGTGKLAKTAKKPSSCPICSATPLHTRSKCPIIKGGIDTMKNRVEDLKLETTDDSEGVRLRTIQELQGLIEKQMSAAEKVKQPSVPQVVQSTSRKTNQDLSDKVGRIAGIHKKNSPLKGPVAKAPPIETSSDSSADSDLRQQVIGDVGQPADILDALIRGPKEFYSVANVPSSDEDEVAETEEMEEDDLVIVERRRRPSVKAFLPDSSDEEDDDEDGFVDADIEMHTLTQNLKNGKGTSVSPNPPPSAVNILSFQTIDGLGSSVEMDKAGNVAVSEALSADQAIHKIPDSQFSGPSLFEDDRMTDVQPVRDLTRLQEETIETIEPVEMPTSLPSSPIEDTPVDVAPPHLSTFKVHASQPVKGKKAQLVGQKPVSSWSPIQKPKTKGIAVVDSIPENGQDHVARRTRTSTRASSQAVLLAVKEKQKISLEAVEHDEVGDLAVTKRGKVAARRKSVPAKSPVKKRATVKTKEKGAVAVFEPPTSSQIGDETAIPNSMSKSMWETLPTESSPAPDGDGSMMVDELHSSQSSPFTLHPPLPVERTGRVVLPRMSPREETQTDGQRSPLFFPSESQVGFPFSQWEEISVNDQANKNGTRPSPDDTDDEDEVQAAVMKLPPSQKLSQQYRRLTDIASQQSLFHKSPSLRAATFPTEKTKVTDLYGHTGGNERSDESDTDSDSASDVEETSHIPRARRAGITRTKK